MTKVLLQDNFIKNNIIIKILNKRFSLQTLSTSNKYTVTCHVNLESKFPTPPTDSAETKETRRHKADWPSFVAVVTSRSLTLTSLQYAKMSDNRFDSLTGSLWTWIAHYTPETQLQVMHQRHHRSPCRTKFMQVVSARKVMLTVFQDGKSILLVDFLPRSAMVNAELYSATLKKLQRDIQNKRRGILSAASMLIHLNTRPHTTNATKISCRIFLVGFDHLPYFARKCLIIHLTVSVSAN